MSILDFFRKRVRVIETVGCMAEDGPTRDAVALNKVTRNVYDGNPGGVDLVCWVVRFKDGTTKEIPAQDLYEAPDGVFEYRY